MAVDLPTNNSVHNPTSLPDKLVGKITPILSSNAGNKSCRVICHLHRPFCDDR